MKKLFSVVAVLAMSVGLMAVLSTPAEAARWNLSSPFAREVVKRGQYDKDTYNIEHVRELQYRLKWLGLLRANATGYFGDETRRAVKRFQKRIGVRQTGVVNYYTWKPLIKRTVRGKRFVPRACRGGGWHACYDRRRHQVTLYRNGRMHNSWLVRGGSYSNQTRTGDFTVFRRSKWHRSNLFDGAPMPYSQFFSGGQALHGSRYMTDPFEGHSHGCVNMYTEDARQLWNLTHDRRLRVHVHGRWS